MDRTQRKVWTKKRMIEELKMKADELGHSPSRREAPYLEKPAKRMFGTWNNAKLAAGLEVYNGQKRANLIETVKGCLKSRPATIREIEEKVEGVYRDLVYSIDGVLSIGPRRSRVYYLDEEGEEERAYEKLEELELEALLNEAKKVEHILDCLDRPMDLWELHEKTQLTTNVLKKYLKFLTEEKQVMKIDNFMIHESYGVYDISVKKGKHRLHLYYRPGQEGFVVEEFSRQLPPSREIDKILKKKITDFIKRYPDPLEEEIKKLYVGIKRRKRGKTEDGRRKRKREEMKRRETKN